MKWAPVRSTPAAPAAWHRRTAELANVSERRIQISTDGGTRPLWAPDGGELFYMRGGSTPAADGAGGTLISVAVTPGADFRVGPPRVVTDRRYFAGSIGVSGRTYDISPDGKRFLVIKNEVAQEASAIVVFSGWRQAR